MTLTIFDPRSGKRVTISLPDGPSGKARLDAAPMPNAGGQ